MPSAAHQRWRQFAADPEDLLRRFEEALDAADPDPHALSRAVVVSLVAAWEAYVEALAVEVAGLRQRDTSWSPRLREIQERANSLNTPNAEKRRVQHDT